MASSVKKHSLFSVDINKADAVTLSTLKGIGPKKAKAIVQYRKDHGPFRQVNDLTKVQGIGAKFLKRLEQKNSGRLKVGTRHIR